MKFIFEKITVEHIKRRVREKERGESRRVTEVLLAPHEWLEFRSHLNAVGFGQEYRIPRDFPTHVRAYDPEEPITPHQAYITVRCE